MPWDIAWVEALPQNYKKDIRNYKTRTYSAPVVDFSIAISPKYETNQEIYRNIGDMVSVFDTGARSNLKLDFMDQPTLTHQYENIANKFKPE